MKRYAFDINRNKKVANEWDNFINKRQVDKNNIRKKIYDSWKRSIEYGVDYANINANILAEEEISTRLMKNDLMCRIALPFMEQIYMLIKDSGSLVLLTDCDGYVLKIFADANIKKSAASNWFVEGSNRSERNAGTNAIGLCLYLDEPVQIWGDEHYALQNKSWACSAAPIHDNKGKMVGALNVSGDADTVHFHTLGMVEACAKAIENEMRLQKVYEKVVEINSSLIATIESFTDGILLIDVDGVINHINTQAQNMLELTEKQAKGRALNELVEYNKSVIDFCHLTKEVSDKEIYLKVGENSNRFFVSTKLVKLEKEKIGGVVITLKKMESIRKLVSRVASAHPNYSFDDIIGKSTKFQETINLAKIASNSSSTVLITGESGTGKEMFVQSIHEASSRRDAPFVAINCAALPKSLIESELFGYERGAFTGARKEGQPGKFEFADGGTIFLDEIGDMPLDVQASLLRVIENKEVTRIGGSKVTPIDVRIIAATNRNLEDAIEENLFRRDLYYRLNVLLINIPPLRERSEDIIELADFFLKRYSSQMDKSKMIIEEKGYDVLKGYSWPGNVRELENIIERAVNFSRSNEITAVELSRHFSSKGIKKASISLDENKQMLHKDSGKNLKDAEKALIVKTLEENDGNIKRTADILGIGRRTLYRKLETYDIEFNQYRDK